nr:hypothetical protein Iba_scaffold1393CG0270 [Ipomoea batatas]
MASEREEMKDQPTGKQLEWEESLCQTSPFGKELVEYPPEPNYHLLLLVGGNEEGILLCISHLMAPVRNFSLPECFLPSLLGQAFGATSGGIVGITSFYYDLQKR